jgi:WhiB family redox-sensing transcriptional regulator
MSTKPLIVWPDNPEWQKRAACRSTRNPEKWFPDRGGDVEPAKAVCRRCPVRNECRRFALANKFVWGVWGGLDENERRELAGERNAVMAELDPQITQVLPIAERLVQAVHSMDPEGTAAALAEAADQMPALVITLAAMLPPDVDLTPLLKRITNSGAYGRLRDAGVDPAAAAVLAERAPTEATPEETPAEVLYG